MRFTTSATGARRVLAAGLLTLLLLGPRLARAEDLPLPEVIRLALAKNERAQIARLTLVTADAAVVKARAAFLPSIALNASESLNPYPATVTAKDGTTSKAACCGVTGSLSVNQPLLVVSAWPLYSAAKHSREAARFSEVDARRQLTFDTAKAFFGVIAQQRVVAAAKGRLARSEESLRETRARAAAQLASSNDVTRATLERASAVQTMVSAQLALEQSRINLEYLIDTPLPAELRGPEGHLEPGTLEVTRLAEQALGQRPDLHAARESYYAAVKQAEEPWLRFVPTLGAAASLKINQSGAPDRHWDTGVVLTLSWALWDGGLRNADHLSRQAAADTANYQMKALKRKVSTDVRNAVAALLAARSTLEAAQEAVTAAGKSAEETTVLYKQGLAKAIELVDATLSRFTSELTLAGAQLGLRQAELDLRSALGLFPLEGLK
jgi:outer membrane protein TolC